MKKIGFLAALLAAFCLSACSGGAETSEETTGTAAETTGRDSLVFGITAEPSTLDPSQSPDFMTHMMQFQLADCLFYENADGELVPGLAESYEISDDGMEYTFTLRQGVKFHNGDEMTAEDVAFTFNNVVQSAYATRMTGHIEKCEVIDDYTVKMTLKYPFPNNIFTLSSAQTSIVNKEVYEADPEGYSRNPVGTGPFRLVEWSPGEKIEMEAFEDYYRGASPIKHLTFRIYTDGTTGALALENGEIDILNVPPVSAKQAILDAGNLAWYAAPSTSEFALWMNYRQGAFSNQKLREAVAAAINRDEIVIGALEGEAEAEYSIAPSTVFGWVDFSGENVQDVEKAKALVAEAGYPDGIDVTLKISDSVTHKATAEIIQAQLAQAGIRVNIETLERASFLDEVDNGQFEMAIQSYSYTIPDADFQLYPNFLSDNIGKIMGNVIGYQNDRVDELLVAGRNSTDQEERAKIYEEVLTILHDDVAAVPLYNSLTNVAANGALKGVQASPIYRYYVYDMSWE